MKTPPLLMGAALIFWGWQTGYLIWAAAMTAVLEASRPVSVRWELAPKDFHRLADICALIFMGLTVYRFAAGTASMARWLPLALFPLMAAQAYSTTAGVDLGAIFYTVRQKEKRGLLDGRRTVDIAYPYLALTVLAASAANQRTPAFIGGLTVLAGWALWTQRPRRRTISFALLFLLAAGTGYAGGLGLNRMQIWLEAGVIDWFSDLEHRRNPLRSVTAIGEIGRLKQYERIVMRLRPIGSFRAGMLLHEASYNRYTGHVWVASRARFRPLPPSAGDPPGTWRLVPSSPAPADLGHAEIILDLGQDGGVLSLPLGCTRISGLAAVRLETNGYGAFLASGPSGWIGYRVAYRGEDSRQSPPTAEDLRIPENETPALATFIARFEPARSDPPRLAAALRQHFRHNFRYSLEQAAPGRGRTPLAHFLEVTHAGHCEFFATATVLALRAAGIPARYASGYAVAEYSRLEGGFIIRARHAHAWALAFIDGRWQPVDSTPGVWLEAEEAQVPTLTPVIDLLRFAAFRLGQWRRQSDDRWQGGWILTAGALLAFALLRTMQKRVRRTASRRPAGMATSAQPPQPPSPWDAVADRLTAAGWPRRPCEPPGEWVQRLTQSGLDPGITAALRRIVRRHYRLRFHPDGLGVEARRHMESDCRRVMQTIDMHHPTTTPGRES